MIDKPQELYDTLIKMANLNYDHSGQPVFSEFKEMLLGKAEAFEDAAAYVSHKFREVKTTTTDRWNETREHHMSEEERKEPKEKIAE